MGGRDVGWCGRGWHLLVLDANRTADATLGTTNKASISRIGVGFNVTATASKSDVIMIDAMYYGTGVEVTGPSLTDGSNGIDLNDNGGSDDTIVRQDAGSFITDGWEVGDYVKVANATTSSNNGVYGPITNVTASTLTIPTGSLSATENNDLSVLVMASVRLKDIYTKDGPTDDTWWGVVSPEPQGGWNINYPLFIGDVSGSNNVFFLSRGEAIFFTDQALDTTKESYIILVEDTGETHVLFGQSNGTGDDRVGSGGSTIVGEDTDFDYGVGTTSRTVKTPRAIDFDAEITSCEVYGTAFVNLDGGGTFAVTGTGHYVANANFQECAQIDLGGVESRNITFSGYTGTDGALYWRNGVTDIKNSFFLACTRGIEHDTASSGESYVGLKFAGNTYDINFSAASGDLVINASKGLFASNPASYTKAGSGSVTINNAVTLWVKVVDIGGNPIQYAQTAIFDASDNELMNEDTDALGVAEVTDYNYPGSPVAMTVVIRKGDAAPKYIAIDQPGEITADGFRGTFAMQADIVNT
jgi:hypothetical protein